MIAKEGYPFVIGTLFIFLFFLLFSSSTFLQLITFALFLFMLYFFRDPERFPEDNSKNAIISPSDGVILEISKDISPITNKEAIKISIRLSLFDVHIQRAPITSYIKAREYIRGAFLTISSKKASILNEQNRVLFSGIDEVVVNQIAGFLTRRIVMKKRIGEKVNVGDRYGMIIFGSQVDLYLPIESDIRVVEFQEVKAGESLIGYLNEN